RAQDGVRVLLLSLDHVVYPDYDDPEVYDQSPVFILPLLSGLGAIALPGFDLRQWSVSAHRDGEPIFPLCNGPINCDGTASIDHLLGTEAFLNPVVSVVTGPNNECLFPPPFDTGCDAVLAEVAAQHWTLELTIH